MNFWLAQLPLLRSHGRSAVFRERTSRLAEHRRRQAIGSGTLSFVESTPFSKCSELTCTDTDLCFCFRYEGTLSFDLIGTASITMDTSQDQNTCSSSGNLPGCCVSTGAGTISTKYGDTINLDFFGQFYTKSASSLARSLNAVYRVTGGTGVFSTAVGGGNLTYDEITPGGPNTPINFRGSLAR